MNWEVRVAKTAAKNLKKVPKKDQARIVCALREITINPFLGDIEKIGGELHAWRRRVGNYRILYELENIEKLVLVRDIRRRTSSTY